jgi:hypothetical protein
MIAYSTFRANRWENGNSRLELEFLVMGEGGQ